MWPWIFWFFAFVHEHHFFPGELQTTARWLREFVEKHPDYKQDSVVSEKINYDLMKACQAIAKGDLIDPKLLIKRVRPPGVDADADPMSEDDLIDEDSSTVKDLPSKFDWSAAK